MLASAWRDVIQTFLRLWMKISSNVKSSTDCFLLALKTIRLNQLMQKFSNKSTVIKYLCGSIQSFRSLFLWEQTSSLKNTWRTVLLFFLGFLCVVLLEISVNEYSYGSKVNSRRTWQVDDKKEKATACTETFLHWKKTNDLIFDIWFLYTADTWN